MKELVSIQTRLVAPKNQKNTFGNYNYRSLEGIMEALKPLLKELGCTITFNDELVMLGDRIFCKSTATLKNAQGETETSTSFAELDMHKGMSKEQSSGSSSSYARKYAVCSLLAIDDNADPDMLDNRDDEEKELKLDNNEVLRAFCTKKKEEGANKDELKKFYDFYSPKMEGWRNEVRPADLWNKWMARAAS